MSDRELQSILDNSAAVIEVKDVSGRYLRINRRFEEIFGLDQSEVLGKTDYDLFPREIADLFQTNDLAVMQAAGPLEFEETAPHQDGPHNYISIKFPLFDDAGAMYATAGILTDITDHKRAEEKMRDSEELFRSIFENSQIGIGLFKIDSQEHISNRALHEMLGYTREELSCVEQWDEIVPAEERVACAQRYAELIQGKRETDEYEQHFIRSDGRIVLGNSKFQLLRDAAGKPQCIVGLTEDITERTRAKEALQASEQLFRSVFENAQIGISILDVAMGELHTNNALHEMLGCTREDLSSLAKWDVIVHPEELHSGARRYAQLVAGERDSDAWEQRFVRRDGRLVIANGRFSVIRDGAGKPRYVLNLSEDITERKLAEEARNRAMQQVQLILESTGQGIFGIDLQGNCSLINRAACELMGYTPEEVLGR